MVWVIVFGAIALVGLAVLVSYVVWLSHKVADVWSEVQVLADRGSQLAALLGQIEPSEVRARDLSDAGAGDLEGEVVLASNPVTAAAT